MGLKGLLSGLGMNGFAVIGLVAFFALFVAIVVWTYTRPQREIECQARLPLEKDDG
jgi:cbb3-type cytochrome oxidase subunit 3